MRHWRHRRCPGRQQLSGGSVGFSFLRECLGKRLRLRLRVGAGGALHDRPQRTHLRERLGVGARGGLKLLTKLVAQALALKRARVRVLTLCGQLAPLVFPRRLGGGVGGLHGCLVCAQAHGKLVVRLCERLRRVLLRLQSRGRSLLQSL